MAIRVVCNNCQEEATDYCYCRKCVDGIKDDHTAAIEAAIERDREERRDEVYQDILSMRNVETQCKACSGLGVKTYPSTATWAGGIGGQMITPAVCDKCWGSGDANRPWTSLKKLKPDPLSADLVRLAEKIPNGRIEWHPGTGIVVLRPGKEGARHYWAGLDCCGTGIGFTTFKAAVAAALREIESK